VSALRAPPLVGREGERSLVDLDLARMRRERGERLREQMVLQGVPAALLFGGGDVQYAVGPETLAGDAARAAHLRTAALVVADDPHPHLFTPYPEGAPPELPTDHVHPALYTESDDGVVRLVGELRELMGTVPGRLALDDMSGPMHRRFPDLLGGTELVDAGPVLGPAKLHKTLDELECIRRSQRINELAMYDVQGALVPGIHQSDLSAVFLRRIYELGCTSNGIDPIWQVMTPTKAEGPYTTNGDVAFPLSTTDRILGEGDVIWCDTGIHYHGYASDFGRTWIVSRHPRPTARQRDAFRAWRDVTAATLGAVRAGATGADLAAAARGAVGGKTPWLAHFYLIHGVGTESAEPPMVGTDLGPEHDANLVLAPGMVLVLEPVIWDDGAAGYRAEDIVAVTDDGYVALSDFPYDPFDD